MCVCVYVYICVCICIYVHDYVRERLARVGSPAVQGHDCLRVSHIYIYLYIYICIYIIKKIIQKTPPGGILPGSTPRY